MPKFLLKAKKWKLDYVLLFLIMAGYYGHIQWNNYIGDPDGFYHAKLAKWLWSGRLIKTMPWMQFATLRDHFTDHQLLYHLILAPFTNIYNPLIGVKVATVLFATVMVLVFYWLLKRLRLSWPWAFSLAFVVLNGLNFRLSLIKVNSLSLIIIWLLIFALFRKKVWLAFILSMIFVWLYAGWPLAILILAGYLASGWIYNHLHRSRLKIFWHQTIRFFHTSVWDKKIKLSLAVLIGLVLGLVINPYWPQNLYFYYQQIIQIALINQGQNFTVGGEWYGTSIFHVISSAPHLFIAAGLIFLVLFFNFKKASRLTWFSFIMTFGFLLLTIKSKRYVEYYMPFALLFTASGTTDIKKIFDWQKVVHFWQQLSIFLKTYLTMVFLVFLTLIMPSTYDRILSVHLSSNWPIGIFEAGSLWLKNNTPEDSVVFHSDWDEWPPLFYYNDHNYYIVGLDPTFMHNYSPKLHELYAAITTGQITVSPARQIQANFNADFILVSKDSHQSFIYQLDHDPHAELTYQDNQLKIYQIK